MNLPVLASYPPLTAQVSLREVAPVSSTTWDGTWQNCSYATYFHSREWAEIWEDYTRGQIVPRPKLVTFSDGKTALLPLCVKRSRQGLVNEYLACVEGGFGGWISQDQLALEHTTIISNYLMKELGNLTWRLNPYEDLVWRMDIPATYSDETHAIDLINDFPTLFSKQSSAARKVRKAEKAGVSITTASTLEDWKEYYQVYQRSLDRWGDQAISEYHWELFQELFQRNSENIRLWIACYEGKIVSGAICLYSKQNVMYWHGSSLEEYFQLRPVNLLMYTIMNNAREQGCSWFDFGSSAGLESVAAFKKSFGASPYPCHIVCTTTPLKRLIEKIEYRLKDHS
jgi:hypothetical protein